MSQHRPLAAHVLLAGLTGLLYPLCFPDFDLGFLAWVALLPLHLVLATATLRRAFWLGWLAGLIAFVGVVSWVVTAMHLYGKVPLAASNAIMVLLAAYLGLYVGLYALGATWLHRALPRLSLLGAPFLWIALEWFRTYLFSGLPWDLIGYSQYRWLTAIQIADHAGVYGVSFVVVLVNVALAETVLWILNRSRRPSEGTRVVPFPWLTPAAAILSVSVTLLYGQSQLDAVSTAPDRSLTIGLVQANIDQAHKWDDAYRRETLDRYLRLTAQAAGGSDLLIWPEAATPFLFERETAYRGEVTDLVRTQGVPLLLGSPALRYYPNGRPYLLNSAYFLAPDGEVLGRYDKQHLVPFGEYIPLKSSLLFFLEKLVEGIGDFEAGTTATVLSVPAKSGTSPAPNPARFGVVICYEVIFPDLVREFARGGAGFMVTITNDAWFGASAAPFQHFGMVVFRAVENRRAFARAANTGISGFIDPQGHILQATPIFEERAVTGRLPVETTLTVYSRYGDVFAYACVIITGLLCGAARWRRRL
ncbi:MAG: apolipoprotein N-acyltransferase [Nitrospirae bacterium]|nr:apolipoprotein N-acyltransferase [Nitrospirota bacterium]